MTDIKKTISAIKRAGFSHIKIELEANLHRNSYHDHDDNCYCEECDEGYTECEHDTACESCGTTGYICSICFDNSLIIDEASHAHTDHQYIDMTCPDCNDGYTECEQTHICNNCDGDGTTCDEDSGGSMTDDFCKEAILNLVSVEAREALTFARFYNDGSVDSELTFTVPVEALPFVPEYIRAFRDLGIESDHFDTVNAGMHLSVLTEAVYPCRTALSSEKLGNFNTQVTKLLPALFFLASPDHKSRPLGFRLPRISNEKYSAIHTQRGSLEYRVFEPCFDKPEAIFDMFAVIAKTLWYYHPTRKVTISYKEFEFPEVPRGAKEYTARFCKSTSAYKALKESISILTKADQTKLFTERGVRLSKIDKLDILEEAKLRLAYEDYVAREREGINRWIKDRIRSNYLLNPAMRELYDSPTLNIQQLKKIKAELQASHGYNPPSFADWKRDMSRNNVKVIF